MRAPWKVSRLVPRSLLFALGAQTTLCGVAGADCTPTLNKEKSLLIRHLSVVEDPTRTGWTGGEKTSADGAWSFGRLIANVSGNRHPSEFTRRWLNTLMEHRIINGDDVPARAWIRDSIVAPWATASGSAELDLTKAPFRLLAIVYRADERDVSNGLGGVLRFVYTAYAPDVDDSRNGAPLPFTVAFDFALPASSLTDAAAWAEQFRALSDMRFGRAYNAALTRITYAVTSRNADPARPNASALLRLLTNDAIDVAAPWVLQEFQISRTTGWLRSTPIEKTPSMRVNGSQLLAAWIRRNRPEILASGERASIPVPPKFRDVQFQAGAVTNTLGTFWNAPQLSGSLLFRVALNTCNGCHGTETDTPFTHIFPRGKGEMSFLSAYLTGNWTGRPGLKLHPVQDPRNTSRTRRFNELSRRARDVVELICGNQNGLARNSR